MLLELFALRFRFFQMVMFLFYCLIAYSVVSWCSVVTISQNIFKSCRSYPKTSTTTYVLECWLCFLFSFFSFNLFWILFRFERLQLRYRVIPQNVGIHSCLKFCKMFCKIVWYILIWLQVHKCFPTMFFVSSFRFIAHAKYFKFNFGIVLLTVSKCPIWCSSSTLVHVGRLYESVKTFFCSLCILLRSVFVSIVPAAFAYMYSGHQCFYRYTIIIDFLFFVLSCFSMLILCCIFVTVLFTWFVQIINNCGAVRENIALCWR